MFSVKCKLATVFKIYFKMLIYLFIFGFNLTDLKHDINIFYLQ